MNTDTRTLLKECNSGCKMAIASMDQVLGFAPEDEICKVLICYKEKHEEIEKRTILLLAEDGEEGKEPNGAAQVFSWFTTEMKMLMRDDNNQIAKLMMEGCNMGIQSICEHQNHCEGASEEAKQVAYDLVHMEETFVKELRKFL